MERLKFFKENPDQKRPLATALRNTKNRIVADAVVIGLSALVLACSAGAPKEVTAVNTLTPPTSEIPSIATPSSTEKPKPAPTSTAEASKATSTATATLIPYTPTPKPPEASPTPESLKFGSYDIYSGKIDGGGDLFISILPDNKVLIQSFKSTPTCDNPSYAPFLFDAVGPVGTNNASFKFNSGHDRFEATLGKDGLSGKITGLDYETNTPSGKVSCPGGILTFILNKVGNGKQALLDTIRKARSIPSSTTDEELQKGIELTANIKLPN